MTLIKPQETRRKFYNKWLYKISISREGVGIFRVVPLESIDDVCTNPHSSRYHFFLKNSGNHAPLIKIAKNLMLEPKENWAIRVESKTLDIYTNNEKFYDTLGNDLSDLIFRRFAPNPKNLDILNGHRKIVAKKLPYNKYKYKVFLRPHELYNDKEAKTSLMDWIKNKDPQIKCSDSTVTWFIDTYWNWDRRYILVENEQCLLMLKMRAGNSLGSVYQYVVADK